MITRTLSFALFALCLTTSAIAQTPGGGGGGGGGHGHGRGGGQASAPTAETNRDARLPAEKPVSEVDVFGVVKAVDPLAQRITIAYEANDPLNLPAGTMPFGVAKTDLLKDVTAGERIRFRLDSHQVSFLAPILTSAPSP